MDKELKAAINYLRDYWFEIVDDVGLEAALTDPPETNDDELADGLGNHAVLAGTPLRESLQLSDQMVKAMLDAHANIGRKVRAQYDDSILPEGNDRYEDQWTRVGGWTMDLTEGPFATLASCQGGDEVDMIFMHPIHGISRKLAAEEYRVRTSPYVAAFGVEVFPSDRQRGLIHEDVLGHLRH